LVAHTVQATVVAVAAFEGVMAYDRRDWEDRQIRVLKQEIAERLRSACGRLPEEEFDQLVDRIARVQHKYEQQRSDELFPSARDVNYPHPAKADDAADHGLSP
jgi:hypothetical protein